MTEPLHPITALARRFTINWLDLADAAVPATIMTPDYQIHIGDVDMDGLEDYTRAAMGQLQRFPGLTLTVHELITDGDQFAIVFTEHGGSHKHDGRPAAWRGVALYRVENGLLAENWTQEDYLGRGRQLACGVVDVIAPPAPAPWTTTPQPVSAEAERTAREWLNRPSFDAVTIDDGSPVNIEPHAVAIARLFSAGDQVAFAARWTGTYTGGLRDVEATDAEVTLGVCGVLDVDGGAVVGGRLVTDRLGLRRSLLAR